MASTKYKMRYGQYTSEVARQLSIDYLGTVVYSGKTCEIWVDGKCIAANFQGGVDDLRTTIGELSNLQTVSKANIVSAINELVSKFENLDASDIDVAEISTDNGKSTLTIHGVKQTDGRIENDDTKDTVINIEGEYSAENPLVTKVYVDNEIEKVLGGEDLEKTLDTIKEIQDELLKDGRYTIIGTVGSEVTVIDVTRVVDEETGTVTYVDENNDVVATETEDGIEYEEGYSDLDRTNVIETLMSGITENSENIENLEGKGLVEGVEVNENKEKGFVVTDETETTDSFGATTKEYTIGVQYGTFKTGRGNVLDPDSNGYTDGIATVKDVQDYVEERMVWDEFVSNADDLADEITNSSEPEYVVPNSTELDEPIVIG